MIAFFVSKTFTLLHCLAAQETRYATLQYRREIAQQYTPLQTRYLPQVKAHALNSPHQLAMDHVDSDEPNENLQHSSYR